jgi:3-hydroxyisobutyrate dehydrogenase-like beta-hydroxyacid dehydrogenase
MSMPTIAIPAAGSMGSAVGAALVRHGATVLTLAGRSQASRARAEAAGMKPVAEADLAGADIILSILPPDQALPLAERLAPALKAAARKPVYADCNAVGPATVAKVAAAVAPTGSLFADAGIIGLPAKPVFYASGEGAAAMQQLLAPPLDIRVMGGPVGAASALKLSYAGITKGLIALGATMTLAAARAGVGEALRDELGASQQALRNGFSRSIGDMLGKARRWVPEMEEIAAFIGTGRPEHRLYASAAEFYAALADAAEAGDPAAETLRTFWKLDPAP